MAKTNIPWADYTINPIVGCTKVSEGCLNCYAEKMAWRLKCMGVKKYQDVVDKDGWTGKIGVDMSVFDKLPKKPKKVFVDSTGDLFHENVDNDLIESVFAHASSTCYGDHTYLFLTKRPERLKGISFTPYENIWLGVSAENQQRADERIPILLQRPAALRFVSLEPLLEEVDISPFICGLPSIYPHCEICSRTPVNCLNWVIVGCESGPKRRKCKIEWIESVVEQCKAASVPVFVKQVSTNGNVEHDINKFPESVRVREWPGINRPG